MNHIPMGGYDNWKCTDPAEEEWDEEDDGEVEPFIDDWESRFDDNGEDMRWR